MKTASMTQQQKREKAAELLGWVRWEGNRGIWVLPDDAGSCYDVPRYDEDLNLMAEAEKHLETTDQKSHYLDHLYAIVCSQAKERWEREWFSVIATAAQRLDAWLEVMMEGEE